MKYLVNDNRHSQLNKQHTPAQTQIDALGRGVGRRNFGDCEVKEMTAQSALTDFTMRGHASGMAWSLNPYVGCLHGCRYCYVPKTMHVERARWGAYVIVKHNLPTLLRKELEEKPKLTVFVSTSTDPYQPIEAERRLTRSALQLLARKDWPVDILTRSPLVTRDIDVFKGFRRVRVGLSVPTIDDEVRRMIEPNAPPVAARLDALRKLGRAGLTAYANYTPAYPGTGFTASDVAKTFKDVGVQWVNTTAWRYQSGYLGRMFDDLKGTKFAQLSRFVGSPLRQGLFRKQLDKAFADEGLRLRTGFFNPPFPDEPVRTPRFQDVLAETMVSANRPCS
ncbi:MAG TPA: radical SAM protein [Candidatus Thermoplasmatota archaeon]|nr:radical SAM protein [Candidatus Thermoplasmatota archaeon]